MDINQQVPWGEIGYVTYKRTYARKYNDNDKSHSAPKEEFHETVLRELEASDKQLKVGFTEEEKELYFNTRMQLKWSVAGRFMWQLGTKTVSKLGLPSLQNCAFTIIDEPIRPFTWTMDMLMLGSGVGYNLQNENIEKLPKLQKKIKIERIDKDDVDFIVPDNREGWIKLLEKTLKAHFYSGKGFTYSAAQIRGKGAPIKGFGGVASGPEELCWGINEIHKILNSRAGKRLTSVNCLDIMNIIGYIVVSGNVRRGAQIAIGDYDDIAFLKAKRWDLGPIPNWRSQSNNSIAVPMNMKLIPDEFWQTYRQGEPYGFINIRLAQLIGRTGEYQYPDLLVKGFNPCAEQGLEDKETCCLADIFLPNIKSKEEFYKVLELSYRMNKHSLRLPCHLKDTEEVVHRNMRMGIGITGYLQATEEQQSWLSDAYEWLREYDKKYSAERGWPISIKLTTVKPSGTLSLLPGVTPGIHPNPAGPYYIRTVRMASESPLVELCRKHGFGIEQEIRFDGTYNPNTIVVSFPCKVPEHTPVAANMSWRDQLDVVRKLQREWSDNSVSCTVYYRLEDIEDIKEYLENHFSDEMKTVSFLLYSGHGFVQAPYQTITKEEYDEFVAKTTPITSANFEESDFEIDECLSGACPIK